MDKILKVSWVCLAIAGCLLTGQSSSAQEQELWRNDWQKFGRAIAPFAKEGALERKGDVLKFNRIFSKQVEWAGTLKAFHSNGVAKFLDLEMEPIRVTLSDGSVAEVKELAISCANEESGCEAWTAELVGQEIIFRTKLINRTRGYLPVVRLEGVGEEGRRIVVETDGAEIVKVVAK